jgi:hypothetical protein
MAERRPKCTVEQPCTTLQDRITESPFSKKPGFATGTKRHAVTGKLTQAPVWFNAPTSACLPEEERMLFLNFCPFCGFDMAPRIERYERELNEASKLDETATTDTST